MKVVTPGHAYQLANFEIVNSYQELKFINKRPVGTDGKMETVHDGTTNEEVLEALINRMQHLQDKFPCDENATVIVNLKESLDLLNKRTADRKARNVEGKHLK